jgi:hypothetical protein
MEFVKGIIGLAISVVVFANVYMFVLKNTSTTTWNATEVAVWGLLSLIGILGLVFGVANVFGLA